MADIWFWQRIVTPHMTGLAVALAREGHTITYAAEEHMSGRRAKQGWQPASLDGVHLRIVPDAATVISAVAEAAVDSIHICQGIRANGLVSVAQKALNQRNLRQWIVMETVSEDGWRGPIRRLLYRTLFARCRPHLQGVLATGWHTSDWVVARGVPADMVFPFAYFLPDVPAPAVDASEVEAPFRFLFVGQFIELKRLDLLIEALGNLAASSVRDFQLQVIGSGPLEASLRSHAERVLGQRVDWVGRLPMERVRQAMASADCLVLPSRCDGWGAVVSEALMAGTPAIASDACGSAGVVMASQVGGVFPTGEVDALRDLLGKVLSAGKVAAQQRRKIADWGACLGAKSGAAYLTGVIRHMQGNGPRPVLPWAESRRGIPG